ncbi:hypothetical protein BJX96DRAFT_170297 [Aspergillus floccosus]
MSDLPKHETHPRRESSLSKELQALIDREERFKDNYGDFENSWTSTRIEDEYTKAQSSEGSRQSLDQTNIKRSDGQRDGNSS